MTQKRLGVFPGTFDPFTNGHKELVDEALKLFDSIIIAVGHGATKPRTLFTLEERLSTIREVFAGNDRVEVHPFQGLIIHFAAKKGATALIRGLRTESDFSYEMPMAITNKRLNDEILTLFFPTSLKNHYISSSLIREVAMHEGDVSAFVPPAVFRVLKNKF